MLKRMLVAAVAALAVAPVFAHAASRGEAKATLAGKTITIDYGRPSLEGRDMLDRATPGEPWRMGADAATTLTTEADLRFGGAAVPKGSYILTATKDDTGGWTLNVRSRSDRAKIADVPLSATPLKESVETLAIELSGEKDRGELEMRWATTALKATFTAK